MKIIKLFLLLFLLVGCNTRNIESKVLWQYAKDFDPCNNISINDICYKLNLSEQGIYLINNCKQDDLYKKSILLLYLKLYREQMERYHQTFNLREHSIKGNLSIFDDKIMKEYIKIVGDKEFLSAAESYYYIKNNYHSNIENEYLKQLIIIDSIYHELEN